jgi:hypothetical protein
MFWKFILTVEENRGPCLTYRSGPKREDGNRKEGKKRKARKRQKTEQERG